MATHSSILGGKSHGQRSLGGYSPWGHKELGMTQWLNSSKHTRKLEVKSLGSFLLKSSLIIPFLQMPRILIIESSVLSTSSNFPHPLPIPIYLLKLTQLCPTLCDPMDCNPPGSFDHGILQARILVCVAIPFSRESSQPRDRTLCLQNNANSWFHAWITLRCPLLVS